MLPKLSEEILGIPRLTNGQIRPTSIRRMKKAGIEDRVIMELTGHKKIENLASYDPLPENTVKIQRSMAIFGAQKPNSQRIATVAQVHSHNGASSVSSTSTVKDQK